MFCDKQSQIAERKNWRRVGGGRPQQRSRITTRSQAHTTNGTRARGRREPGQKPQPHTGPVRGIALAVRRHRAQPNTSQ